MSDDQLSRIFAALSDPTRRDIVARLSLGDAGVSQLAEPYGISIQAVSKHLKVLEDAGLISQIRDAQRRPRHLEADVFDLMTSWVAKYRRQAEQRFERLDALLTDLGDPNPTRGGSDEHHHQADDDRGRSDPAYHPHHP